MTDGANVLARLLSSEVKGDLLVLFHKNPGLIDTMEGVGRRIGRLASAVEEEIRDLVNLGVLKAKMIGKSEVFSLDPARDSNLQQAAASHIRGINIETGREER